MSQEMFHKVSSLYHAMKNHIENNGKVLMQMLQVASQNNAVVAVLLTLVLHTLYHNCRANYYIWY
eukprot:UN05602